MRHTLIISIFLLSLLQAAPLLAQLVDFSPLATNLPIQEKAYLHLDNNCYFKGDTIWYKAYVVRADNHRVTDMSRILYVELISPDGMVVERQNHIITDQGLGDGCFAISDSLYSGYYELRAYTRWMLNFGVSTRKHTFTANDHFYNRQMAEDFFRTYDGLFSRVVPIYEHPSKEGDYSQRYIFERTKTRLEQKAKPSLHVSFFPEGGHLIAGQRCTIAFEITDQEGKAVNDSGTLTVGSKTVNICTLHQGRGLVTIDIPEHGRLYATFEHEGKKYNFDLPEIENNGCALHIIQQEDTLLTSIAWQHSSPTISPYIALLCRGEVKTMRQLQLSKQGQATEIFPLSDLSSGVYNIVVFDQAGIPWADRLIFVNRHEYDATAVSINTPLTDPLQPLQQISLDLQTDTSVHHLSVSVRDYLSEDLTYNTGSILTELLLSSELKGFVAHPDYYFEADDQQHRQALDLLMMVQGWRRYDFASYLQSSDQKLRYQPEQYMTVEGHVYEVQDFNNPLPEEVSSWRYGNIFPLKDSIEAIGIPFIPKVPDRNDPYLIHNKKPVKDKVSVLGELILTDEIADVELQTNDDGQFIINIPPYYGDAVLFLRAQKNNISDKKKHKLENRGHIDETQWPEFYVKRDLFYPAFANPYNYYQNHRPEPDSLQTRGDQVHLSDQERLSDMDRELEGVEISKRKRRGQSSVDYTKPAYTIDAYELYNLVTDRGLSFGKLNFRYFPIQIVTTLLGNFMDESRAPHIDARMNYGEKHDLFYRSYKPTSEAKLISTPTNGTNEITKNLYLRCLDEIRIFTDFELRHPEKPLVHTLEPDIIIDFVLMPNESRRYSYRDRRIKLPGFHMPAQFYNPDYSKRPLPAEASDFRRTLFWNANAPVDSQGRCSISFYNNSTAQQLHISVAGISSQGQPVVLEQVLY